MARRGQEGLMQARRRCFLLVEVARRGIFDLPCLQGRHRAYRGAGQLAKQTIDSDLPVGNRLRQVRKTGRNTGMRLRLFVPSTAHSGRDHRPGRCPRRGVIQTMLMCHTAEKVEEEKTAEKTARSRRWTSRRGTRRFTTRPGRKRSGR